MAVVPPDQAPDEHSAAISAQITTAKEEILIPLRLWIQVKMITLISVNFAAYMTRSFDGTFMEYYIVSFSPLAFLFSSFPESLTKIYAMVYSANKITRGMRHFIDGCVCIFAVSLLFLVLRFAYMHFHITEFIVWIAAVRWIFVNGFFPECSLNSCMSESIHYYTQLVYAGYIYLSVYWGYKRYRIYTNLKRIHLELRKRL